VNVVDGLFRSSFSQYNKQQQGIGGKEKGLRGVVVTISFPDKRHRNGKKVFLLQCNSITRYAMLLLGGSLEGRLLAAALMRR